MSRYNFRMARSIQSLRLAAAERGDKFFQPPEPCNKCGDDTRYVASNQCVTCSKRRAAENTRAFRDKLRKLQQEAERE